MITCPRCGLNLRPDVPACPRCHTVLAAPGPAGFTDASVPAWVRQFQAQQAAQPGGAPAGYMPGGAPPGQPPRPGYGPPGPAWGPGGNLFDEGALPEWLRQGVNAMGAYQAGMQPPGMPPSAHGPGPAAGPFGPPAPAGFRAGGDMQARALIDDRALPAWMNQPASAGPSGGTFGPREGMDARSLIDENSLPQWLRGQPVNPGAQVNSAPFAQEPLPAWLTQPSTQAAPPGMPAAMPPAAPLGGTRPNGIGPGAGPGAGQFADESALPEWLRTQGASASAGGRQGFAATNLVDPAALPAWVRADPRPNGAAGMANAQAPQARPRARRPPDSSWLTDARVPAQPGPEYTPAESAQGESDLPPWLRTSPEGGGQPPAGAPDGTGAFAPVGDVGRQGSLREDELPPWLRQGQGPGQPAADHTRPNRYPGGAGGGPGAGPRRDYGGQQRPPQGYGPGYNQRYDRGGYGGADEWDEQGSAEDYAGEQYQGWDDGGRSQRSRGGFFGRFRRK